MGNFFTIRDVLKKYHGMAMRWFLVGTQYRQPMNYSQVALEEASARLYYLTETLVESKKMISASGAPHNSIVNRSMSLSVCVCGSDKLHGSNVASSPSLMLIMHS